MTTDDAAATDPGDIPEETDNLPRDEDGPQDVDQEPTPIPGSPTDG